MSLQISNIALHFLSKQLLSTEEGSASVNLTHGPENIELTPKVEQFISSLHKIYNAKGSKAYGRFTSIPKASDEAKFVDLMASYSEQQQGFYNFSIQAGNLLKQELEKYDLDETGYLLMCHYEFMGGRYLLVGIIPVSEHYSVDKELHIASNQHLDTEKIQLVARIDLFDYQQNPESDRYISFIKGRAGRKVSDFFLDFLGCEEGLNAKEQSQTLVQAVEDFVSVNQLDADEKQQTRKEMLSYCKEQKSSGQDVSLKELSNTLGATDENKDFYGFCQEQNYPLAESFPHEQAVINKATKYSGYGNGISISFERNHFGQDVVYNQANDSLTIYKIPPNLKEQLLSLLQTASTSPVNSVVPSEIAPEAEF
ncbi:MAG: nucleoid-associated protein YejK [Alteromonadaceae bacterium]|nr:nucleoid-associated protein YejK [Alteromonadaceae bacterium]